MISIYKEYIVLLFVSFRVLFCLFFDTNTHLLFLPVLRLFETEDGISNSRVKIFAILNTIYIATVTINTTDQTPSKSRNHQQWPHSYHLYLLQKSMY